MKKIYITLICLLLFKSFLNAQTFEREWVSLNIDSTTDYVNLNAMAVDSNGNSYLSGYETEPGDEYYETHLYIVKITAAGKLDWKRNFNKKKDSIDEAIAIAVDADGYIYVTGRRIDTFCNICTYNTKISDIITMKYDAEGKRIWLNRYHDSDYILAAPSHIALSPDGTILITGNERQFKSEFGTYISNLLIQKINKNGKTVWVKKMDDVVGNAGCFDNDNNIVIAGASDPDHYYNTQKPMVLKFKPNGNLIWSNIFNENNKYGRLHFVYTDSLNNIYVNGQTDTMAFYNNPRIITSKYNRNGVMQWLSKEANFTTIRDFKTDASGNLYLSGSLNKSGVDNDWITVKYNNAGQKKWSKTFDDIYHGSDHPAGLIIDSKKNVFVTGYVYGDDGNLAIATVGYNKTGDLLFSDIYSRKKSNGVGRGIGIDKYDNVYVGGKIGFYSKPRAASVVIKYIFNKDAPVTGDKLPEVINELKLFPNPVRSSMQVAFTTSLPAGNYKLIVTDVSGNTVLSKQLNSSEKITNINVDVSHLKPGIYTANITNGINSVSRTFIKE